MRNRRFERAISDFTKASDLGPESAAALVLRAYAYESHGNVKAALQDQDRLSHLEPKNSSHPYNFARLALSNTDHDPIMLHDALEHAQRAVEIDPHPLNIQMLARIQSALGLFDEAARNYMTVTESGNEIWAQTYAAFLELHGFLRTGFGRSPRSSSVTVEIVRQYLENGHMLAVRLPVRIPDLAELASGQAHHTAGLN